MAVPSRRHSIECVMLTLLATSVVGIWFWLFATNPAFQCQLGFVYLAGIWLLAQWAVLGYLAILTLPLVFRESVKLSLLISNIWFGLFLFSLSACGAQ